jgi:seryl-tRNA synthetase
MSLYVPAGVVFMVFKRGAVKVKLKQRGQVGRRWEFTFPVKDHVELGLALDLFDFEAAFEVCSAWPYPFESN